MWTSEQLAYMAGIVDGEGTIAIFTSTNSTKGKKYPCYCPRLCVYNCSEDLMLWLTENFKGSARMVKRSRNTGEKWRAAYIWETNRKWATKVIEAILPYLVIKKAQARLFLEFRKTTPSRNRYGHRGLPDNVVEIRQGLIEQIKHLNRRGSRALDSGRRATAHA